MKTRLTGVDLWFILDLLRFQLRIANESEEYKESCKILIGKIQESLAKIKIEIK